MHISSAYAHRIRVGCPFINTMGLRTFIDKMIIFSQASFLYSHRKLIAE